MIDTDANPSPEQTFFEDPAIDRLMGVTMALAAEVYVLRERLRALEGTERRRRRAAGGCRRLRGEDPLAAARRAAVARPAVITAAIATTTRTSEFVAASTQLVAWPALPLAVRAGERRAATRGRDADHASLLRVARAPSAADEVQRTARPRWRSRSATATRWLASRSDRSRRTCCSSIPISRCPITTPPATSTSSRAGSRRNRARTSIAKR